MNLAALTSAMAPEIRDSRFVSGVSYCLMLTFGSFALADYNTYGVGVMEVGTFYALCKIYLSPLAKNQKKLTKEQANENQRNVDQENSQKGSQRSLSWSKHFESIHDPVVSRTKAWESTSVACPRSLSTCSRTVHLLELQHFHFGHLWSS